MEPLQKQNYYELLELSADASPLEISRAYKKALELYQDGSIASYSFFSKEDRQDLISSLGEAFITLITPDARKEYDDTLMELGILEKEKKYQHKVKTPIPIYDLKIYQPLIFSANNRSEDLKNQALKNPLIQNILSQDTLTGADLRKIRTALEVPLEEVAQWTNVRISMLQAIEEDKYYLFPPMVYLKGFLKSYAQCLQIDENIIVSGYIKQIGNSN